MEIGTPFGTIESRGIECDTGIFLGSPDTEVSGLVDIQDFDPLANEAYNGAMELNQNICMIGDLNSGDTDNALIRHEDVKNPLYIGAIEIPQDPNGYGTDTTYFEYGTIGDVPRLIATLDNDSDTVDQTFAVWLLSETAGASFPRRVYNMNNLLDSVDISTAQGLKGCSIVNGTDIVLFGHSPEARSTEALITAVDFSDPTNPEVVDYVGPSSPVFDDGNSADYAFMLSSNEKAHYRKNEQAQVLVEYDGGISTTPVDLPQMDLQNQTFDGNYAYTRDGIIDLSEPTNPTKISDLPTFDGAYPEEEYIRAQLPKGSPSDGILYAGIREGLNTGLRAIDVSDPASPEVISDTLVASGFDGSFEAEATEYPRRITETITGGFAYGTLRTGFDEQKLGLLKHGEGEPYIPFEDSPEPRRVPR